MRVNVESVRAGDVESRARREQTGKRAKFEEESSYTWLVFAQSGKQRDTAAVAGIEEWARSK